MALSGVGDEMSGDWLSWKEVWLSGSGVVALLVGLGTDGVDRWGPCQHQGRIGQGEVGEDRIGIVCVHTCVCAWLHV